MNHVLFVHYNINKIKDWANIQLVKLKDLN